MHWERYILRQVVVVSATCCLGGVSLHPEVVSNRKLILVESAASFRRVL